MGGTLLYPHGHLQCLMFVNSLIPFTLIEPRVIDLQAKM